MDVPLTWRPPRVPPPSDAVPSRLRRSQGPNSLSLVTAPAVDAPREGLGALRGRFRVL